MLHRLLCFFGLHLWTDWEEKRGGENDWRNRKCKVCPKYQSQEEITYHEWKWRRK